QPSEVGQKRDSSAKPFIARPSTRNKRSLRNAALTRRPSTRDIGKDPPRACDSDAAAVAAAATDPSASSVVASADGSTSSTATNRTGGGGAPASSQNSLSRAFTPPR